MKKLFCVVLTLAILMMGGTAVMADKSGKSVLYYQGHGSFRITTAEGKVIYVDPHAGDGYDSPLLRRCRQAIIQTTT